MRNPFRPPSIKRLMPRPVRRATNLVPSGRTVASTSARRAPRKIR